MPVTERITDAERAALTRKYGVQLRALSRNALTLKPDFRETADRWEAWWRFKADRPLFLAWVGNSSPDVRWGKAFDLLENDPEAWLRVRCQQVENTVWLGESIPHIRVDIGPVAIAAFLGATLHLSETEQTSWQTPMIEDWPKTTFRFNPDNPWYRRVRDLIRLTARDAAGRYLVCLPDLSGAIDALSNMRGPDRLCMDLFEFGPDILRVAGEIVDAWERMFFDFHEIALKEGSGLIQWLQCWSDTPYTLPTCDFNYLIGPEHFMEFCMPSLRDQAQRAGRCVLHVDGYQAIKHVEALAAEPALTAIQFTPGAGTPSALAKIAELRRLQEAGKPLVVCCPAEEIPDLIRRLDRRGLAIIPEGGLSLNQLRQLEVMIRRG